MKGECRIYTGKYFPLSHHLAALAVSRWDATFEEIEAILGFPLPDSARTHNPSWANQSGGGHTQTKAWTEAWQSVGWRTANVRPAEGRVTFVREHQLPARAALLRDG